jgi:mannosyltransferase OCH1-like enzyme
MIGYFDSANIGDPRPDLNHKEWFEFETLYMLHWLFAKDKTPKIPKLLHLVWLGGEYPKEYNVLLDSWKKHHPDWEIKIWDDNDAESFDMINRTAFETVKNPGTKSDIFRYEILLKHGGIYIDTDFVCYKPFDDLLYLDFFAGNGHFENPDILNSLMGCAPNNKIIQEIVYRLKNQEFVDETNYTNILHYSGAYYITKIFMELCNEGKNVIFPTTFFFSFPAAARFSIRKNQDWYKIVSGYKQPESYCAHLWSTSWQD